jgi:hypothetical protein
MGLTGWKAQRPNFLKQEGVNRLIRVQCLAPCLQGNLQLFLLRSRVDRPLELLILRRRSVVVPSSHYAQRSIQNLFQIAESRLIIVQAPANYLLRLVASVCVSDLAATRSGAWRLFIGKKIVT